MRDSVRTCPKYIFKPIYLLIMRLLDPMAVKISVNSVIKGSIAEMQTQVHLWIISEHNIVSVNWPNGN